MIPKAVMKSLSLKIKKDTERIDGKFLKSVLIFACCVQKEVYIRVLPNAELTS